MLRVLEVSSSGYYDWKSRPQSKRAQEDEALKEKIHKSHEDSRQTYGARRIQSDLIDDGHTVSRTRVRRLMKEECLESKVKKKFKATTDSKHDKPVAENKLNRDFDPEAPDQVYAGDITYIHTAEGWLYLAVFIDLYSRAVVGWSMSNRMKASLVNDALTMARWNRKPKPGLIVHSDRGSQYVSDIYQKQLRDHKFVCSMSRKGNCWDNAPSESFFHTLKIELIHHMHYQTREEAKQSIFEYISVFYNRKRKHSSNGYLSPEVYELKMAKAG